jgi:bleomycin hydrolase
MAKKNAAAGGQLLPAVEVPSLGNADAGVGQLSPAFLQGAKAAFLASPKNRLAQNVITKVSVLEAAVDRDAHAGTNHHFSTALRDTLGEEGLATSQGGSGRCWMFAMLNTLRLPIIKALDLPRDFELSQSYLFFWDKIERSNFFLQTIIETPDEPFDSRLIQYLLQAPVNDGGQWDMCVNLITKYGVMPQEVFPESETTMAAARMNYMLTNKLRQFASELRDLWSAGMSTAELQAKKLEMMAVVHNVVMIHMGTPPTEFSWSYTDKQNKFHSMAGITPQDFYAKVCPVDVTTKISLINDPRNPYYKLYTVDRLNNMVGGLPVRYVNLPVEELHKYAMATLDANEPVWFGCDCGKFMEREQGIFDTDLFDYELIYDTAPGMDKLTRLNFGESAMTHAMVFTAYDRPAGEALPTKWRVENSWGSGAGDKGYYVMTKAWFDEWMYQIAVDVSALAPEVAAGEQQIGGSGGSLEPPGPLLEPPGPLLTHLTRLNPLAERACFPQVHRPREPSESDF